MTPEQAARFVLGDCQDPALKALAARALEDQFIEAMRDPAFKARWIASLRTVADDIDAQIVDDVMRQIAWTQSVEDID